MGVGPDDLPGSIQFYSLKTWLQLHLDWIISLFLFHVVAIQVQSIQSIDMKSEKHL